MDGNRNQKVTDSLHTFGEMVNNQIYRHMGFLKSTVGDTERHDNSHQEFD